MKKLGNTFISVPFLLTTLFVGLKLAGIITWPWLIVTLPLWFGWALGLALVLVYFLGLAAYAAAVGIIWLVAILVSKLKSL